MSKQQPTESLQRAYYCVLWLQYTLYVLIGMHEPDEE